MAQVLVIDDKLEMRIAPRQMLEQAGHQVALRPITGTAASSLCISSR